MFGKTIKKLNDKQIKWLENIEHQGKNHFQFSESMSDEERQAFLRHSSFLDNTHRKAFSTAGLYEQADFVNSVRADILYLETFGHKKKTSIILHGLQKESSPIAKSIRKQALFSLTFVFLISLALFLFGMKQIAYSVLAGALMFFFSLIFGSLSE